MASRWVGKDDRGRSVEGRVPMPTTARLGRLAIPAGKGMSWKDGAFVPAKGVECAMGRSPPRARPRTWPPRHVTASKLRASEGRIGIAVVAFLVLFAVNPSLALTILWFIMRGGRGGGGDGGGFSGGGGRSGGGGARGGW